MVLDASEDGLIAGSPARSKMAQSVRSSPWREAKVTPSTSVFACRCVATDCVTARGQAVFEGGGIEVVQVKQVRKRDEVRAQCCDRLAAARSRNL